MESARLSRGRQQPNKGRCNSETGLMCAVRPVQPSGREDMGMTREDEEEAGEEDADEEEEEEEEYDDE